MFKTRRGLLLILILFFMGWLPFGIDDVKELFRSDAPGIAKEDLPLETEIVLTNSAQKHILYGDSRGGGHKYGVGKPCKSEFPADWDNEKILSTIQGMAANDNVRWKRQDNGYYVSEQMDGNIRVRVVLDDERKRIITAYPVNVKRNPCPSPANDNFNQ